MSSYCLPASVGFHSQYSSVVCDLGVTVTLDSQLTMTVISPCHNGLWRYQLRQLRQITQSLTPTVAQTLVQAFISCRLDYCNSLLYGIADSQLRRLQSVQNAAAWLITGTWHTEYITPVLQLLQWLPVRQRILFKLAVLVCKCINGHAPAYLADDCCLICHCRAGLRSSDLMKLDVPPTRTAFGDRLFAVNGTCIWNSLPASIRNRHQFATRNCHWHFLAADSSLICSFNSCGVCDSERTPHKRSN